MLESKIEKDVTNYAKLLGWIAYKFTSPANRGVPDHIYFREGHTLLIEFKQLGKKPSKLQQHQINKFKDQLIPVYVVDSIENGKDIFNAY
jgi:Holliday junction resolvase